MKLKAVYNIGYELRRRRTLFICLMFSVVLLFIIDIFSGSVSIAPGDILRALINHSHSEYNVIILNFRLPKAATALLVGIALSLSGLQMQTVFRNPMAGADVLGITSGAGLGVAIIILGFASYFTAGSISVAGNWLLAMAAWAGAALVLLLMMVISSRVRDIMTILILGIMLSSGISAIVTVMQYFSSETLLKSYVVWTMGSLGNLASGQLMVLSVTVCTGIILSLFSMKMMNALLLGENYASSLGVKVKPARLLIFLCTSILAGSVTAFCGPIGFIGIAVPHIARMMFRTSDHRVLIPGTILAGGAVVLLSDIISQLPGSENVLPVNAVTSFIGIPVVILVIFRNRRYSEAFR